MAHLSKSLAALRVGGDALLPNEITKLLGCAPTNSHVKGEVIRGKATGREIAMKTGMWRLQASDREPENLNAQVSEILSKLTPDLTVWSKLNDRFEIDIFCGFFMTESNEGGEVSSETLRLLGERGIKLEIDIYGPIQQIKTDESCPCGSGESYGNCCRPRIARD